MKELPPPIKSGFYWATWKDSDDPVMIVRVIGISPFFRALAWYFNYTSIKKDNTFYITDFDRVSWGPEIIWPEDDDA